MSPDKKVKEELRKHPRVDIHIPAEYQVLYPEKGKNKVSFETENISIGGLMFYSHSKIAPGAHLLIQLYVDQTPVEFSAKVVWTTEWPDPEDPKKAFAIGLQYLKITSEVVSKINQATSRIVFLQPKSMEP